MSADTSKEDLPPPKFCPECGAKVDPLTKLCENCGKPLTVAAAPPPPSGSRAFVPPVSAFIEPVGELIAQQMLLPPSRPGLLAVLDDFEIVRVLGGGGMGIVLLAHDANTGDKVAIKMVKPELATNSYVVHRFLKEAGHLKRLCHINIVPIRQISNRLEIPFFLMPYFDRGSLANCIKPGRPLDSEFILDIARQVAEGLNFAHRSGLIHRDLKPANILLDANGFACLADFGLARTIFNDRTVDVQNRHLEGTAPYMSPAVAAGDAEGTCCDIYSFGAVLYEMLTCQLPYQGRSTKEILDQILAGPPKPIANLNPCADRSLVAIAEKAMARELRNRYTDIRDVLEDLRRFKNGQVLGWQQSNEAVALERQLDKDTAVLDQEPEINKDRSISKIIWVSACLVGMVVLAFGIWRERFATNATPRHSKKLVAATTTTPEGGSSSTIPKTDYFLIDPDSGRIRRFSTNGWSMPFGTGTLTFNYWKIPREVGPGKTVASQISYTMAGRYNGQSVTHKALLTERQPDSPTSKTVLTEWQPDSPNARLEFVEYELLVGAGTRVENFTFTAPTTPGTYRLCLTMTWQLNSVVRFPGDNSETSTENLNLAPWAEVKFRVVANSNTIVSAATTTALSAANSIKGLVAYYPFNGNANDASGNLNDGTVHGATLTVDRFWKPNGAIRFYGNDHSYINVIPSSTLYFPDELTVSLWCCVEGSGTLTPRLVSIDTQHGAYEMAFNQTLRQFSFGYSPVGSSGRIARWKAPFAIGEWVQLVGVATRAKSLLYVNGKLAASAFGPLLDSAGKTIRMNIGRKAHSGYDAFDGEIGDVRLYDRALSAAEVRKLAQAGDAPKAAVKHDTIVNPEY